MSRRARDDRRAVVELAVLGSTAHAALIKLGWKPAPSAGSWSAYVLRGGVAHDSDPDELVDLAARTLALTSQRPTAPGDLEISLRDMSSDAGWAQAGCLFAAPGSLIGAAVGFFAAAKLGIPLEGIDLLIGLFVGASLAYLGGGMAATLTMMVIGMLGPLRNYKELFSYSAWLVGSVATGVLLILAYNRVWP